MDEKICVDTDVLIDVIKKNPRVEEIAPLLEDKEVFTTVVNVFELHLRKTKLEVIKKQLQDIEILEFSEKAAVEASIIKKNLEEKGKPLDFRDVFVGSIAKVNNCELVTFNTKHFENMEGVRIFRQED